MSKAYRDVGIQDVYDSCNQDKLRNSHVCKGYRELCHGNEKRRLYKPLISLETIARNAGIASS